MKDDELNLPLPQFIIIIFSGHKPGGYHVFYHVCPSVCSQLLSTNFSVIIFWNFSDRVLKELSLCELQFFKNLFYKLTIYYF